MQSRFDDHMESFLSISPSLSRLTPKSRVPNGYLLTVSINRTDEDEIDERSVNKATWTT